MAKLRSLFEIKELSSPYQGIVDSVVSGNKGFVFKVKYNEKQSDGKKKEKEEKVFIDINLVEDSFYIKKDENLILEGDSKKLKIKNYICASPKNSREALTFNNSDNFSIKFHKFARFDKDKFSFYKTDKGKTIYNDVEGYSFSGIQFDSLCKNIEDSAKTLFPNFNKVLTFKPDWRLAIGLGTESVYETSINLHPVYGFPYIPGQAIKGITRSWIVIKCFNGNEGKAIENLTFCKMFGCPKELSLDLRNEKGELIKENGKTKTKKYKSAFEKEYQGSVVFFDAYPKTVPKLKVDVMNPHYGPYYSDNTNTKPPADYYNPVPIPFLTVEDTDFQFVLGIRENDNKICEDFNGDTKNTLFELAQKYLKEALEEKGLGAKTAVGYGYFNETDKKIQ